MTENKDWHIDRIKEEIYAGRTQNALSYVSFAIAVFLGKAEAFDRICAARKKHVDAVASYNARRELANAERMRGSWAIKLDEEYRAMSDAQSDFHRIVQDVCDAALVAPEDTTHA